MTSYLAAGGVQQFSITIPNGQVSAGYTLPISVGSGAFVVSQGLTTTDSTTGVSAKAIITISGNVVTATRNTASTDTVTVNGAVVDGDTTNLIKSVQYASVTVATGSLTGNAPISAVTNANTAVFHLGETTTTGLTLSRIACALSLSGTTLTATRAVTSGVDTVAACIVEFQPGALNQATQQVSIATGSGTQFTSTPFNAVSVSNTMLAFGGTSDATTAPTRAFAWGKLLSSTTVQSNYGASVGAGGLYNCTVIEFIPGIFTIKRGQISIAAGTSNTAALSPAMTKASTLCNWLGNKSDQAAGGYNISSANITQTSDSLLAMAINTAASPVGSYEMVGFFPPPASAMDFGMGMVA